MRIGEVFILTWNDIDLDNRIIKINKTVYAKDKEEKGSYEEIQYGEINNMFINDNYRGYGIGKKLINSFKNYCKDNNIFNLKVTASYKNENAIAFYHRNGFEEFNLTLTMNIDKENKNEI